MNNTIRVKRAEHTITQDQLASQLGVSRQTINAIENNKYFPSLELALRMAQIFSCTVDELFSLD
ncbi:MAG: helix-turn-helix transcriptional regulator [Bacteroidetes bacterium]|nr:helix-turn-helix transcriptional regulator [Bacteroidota bacterium]